MDSKDCLINEFDEWVEKLPPEYRQEAYHFAEFFFRIGGIQACKKYLAHIQKKGKTASITAP